MIRIGLLVSGLVFSSLALAMEVRLPPDLPPTIVARQLLDADARILNARAALDAARV